MMIKPGSIVLMLLFMYSTSFSQIRQIPSEVISSFEKQYPSATDIAYKDHLKSVNVHFLMDSAKMVAKYNNKGEWKETEKEFSFESLDAEVKDGFNKSKYATDDWEVKETAIIYLPGNIERYRIKVERSEVQKKYLFFDKNGRLIRDAITI